MTNPTPHGQVPEALRLAHIFDSPLPPEWPDMVAAAAELRRQHARIAELEAVGAGGVQALSAAPGVTSEQRRLIGVIADKIEDGTLFQYGIYPKKDLARFVRNMLDVTPTAPAASPTPPAEQQAEPGAVGRTGCTAGTDEECTRRGCATTCPALQAAPKEAPGEPTPELQRMTASRAAFFIERFLREEKLLGPNERAAVQFALNMLEAAPQPSPTAPATQQPEGDVVAYLDVGANGYLDLGSELSEDALQQLPKGRHALVIAGTYGIDGYTAASTPQSAPAGVLEDAARWHWMAEYIVGTRTDLDEEIVASETVNDLRKLVDAARKQGGA